MHQPIDDIMQNWTLDFTNINFICYKKHFNTFMPLILFKINIIINIKNTNNIMSFDRLKHWIVHVIDSIMYITRFLNRFMIPCIFYL